MKNKIDKLGRLVIPKNLRQKYNLKEGVAVDFFEKDGELLIIPSSLFCKMCHSTLSHEHRIPLCEVCIQKVKNL